VNASGPRPAERTIVVGAHYDSFAHSLGANDNGSGTAAVIELVRLLSDLETLRTRLILVLFVNEEPPYFQTPDMGSLRFAKLLAARREPIAAMLSLETIGFYSDRPRSQDYPTPLNLLFPSTAKFVAFVAMPGSRGLLYEVVRAFRETARFPSIGGVGPSLIPGLGWSDH
jgi:Zn-dependent M28 family amino/carboxypeptidase